ncbi:hypothetical protein FJR48_09350 [Sulfurimonas lithotrophica]|uniref:Prokaryotic metallothionein n=2 Tax=Sulfurimonas lithotrophica TaxID=2590022 RepID=A0A5P8P2S1_9BACT|nr:hypothetical protein FJR48_09350 [Sulfurimonas lithotrophica]
MIMKLLLVIGVIAAVYFFFIKKKPSEVKDKNNTKKDNTPSNEMVECASCGIYCDINDTILSNNKYYCSKECVNKG